MSAKLVSFPRVANPTELPDPSGSPCGQRRVYLIAKRIMDIVGATVMLALASPVIVLTAILIRLESEGPAIYVQERVGAKYIRRQGRIVWQIRHFRFYKLRTMKQNAPASIHKEYILRFRNGGAEAGPKRAPYKLAQDPRITRIGHWLRKTSLDELPQLANVLLGDMSLVGPRPVPIYEVELYDEAHFNRLAALPGITGLWQVYGRSRVSFEQMVEMDVEYVRQSSLWLDIKLLVFTIVSVMSLKGAA